MVTAKVDSQFGEVVPEDNNHISTFVTVAKEGLSVLYVEGKFRAWEPKFIRLALDDPRIRIFPVVRTTDEPFNHDDAPFFDFTKQHYDVIILGDISPKRLSGGNEQVLKDIRDQVARGTGLMMIGGYESFGPDWPRARSPRSCPSSSMPTGKIPAWSRWCRPPTAWNAT
jgi:hypothetical protein